MDNVLIVLLSHQAECNFFQWIDGPEMVDERILLFRPSSAYSYEKFNRWVPPPPNPPRLTAEEKKLAIARRLANPPLCHCGDPAKLDRQMPNCPWPPSFRCPNRGPVSEVLFASICMWLISLGC